MGELSAVLKVEKMLQEPGTRTQLSLKRDAHDVAPIPAVQKSCP